MHRRLLLCVLGCAVVVCAVASDRAPPPRAEDITQVHVVFSNHLDVGFDGIDPVLGFSKNVVNRYFDVYFPRAIQTANSMRSLGTDRFIWMTQRCVFVCACA